MIVKFPKLLVIIYCAFLLHSFAEGQTDTKFSISNSTLGSTENRLPFWFWANHDGKIKPGESFLNLTDFDVRTNSFFPNNKNWQFSAGTNWVGALGSESYFQINQLFGAVDYKGWKLEGGLFSDELQFGGLSTSNGNLARSRNARPFPKIRLSTSDYKPVPGVQNWLFFRFEFDEGFLNDKRYVEHTHLHHKSLYLKVVPEERWAIQMGVEHFVMWGGTSRNKEIGKMPNGFKSYLKYITGRSGSSDFPTIDQENIAGNQYGTYQLKVSKEFEDFTLHFNLSHPFEDYSGINWRNWRDNLLGLMIDFDDSERFFSEILYEFVNTRHQGIVEEFRMNEETGELERITADNYFNNGVYRSGATYHQMAMSSPLFFPIKVEDGISQGFLSNRFYAHHLGAKGKCFNNIYWEGLFTYIEHFGKYTADMHDQEMLLFLGFDYKNPSFPFDIGIRFAADQGYNPGNIYGGQITLSKTW